MCGDQPSRWPMGALSGRSTSVRGDTETRTSCQVAPGTAWGLPCSLRLAQPREIPAKVGHSLVVAPHPGCHDVSERQMAVAVHRNGAHDGPGQFPEAPHAEPNQWFSSTPNRPLSDPAPAEITPHLAQWRKAIDSPLPLMR